MADPCYYYEDPRIDIKVPVVFWGHKYPGDEHGDTFEVRFNPLTKNWGYTEKSAYRADKPYCRWIDETFKPNYKNIKEGEEAIMLTKTLILKDGNPRYIEWGLIKKLPFSEATKQELRDWKYWEGTPKPYLDPYYIDLDLDTDDWQSADALIKTKGTDF